MYWCPSLRVGMWWQVILSFFWSSFLKWEFFVCCCFLIVDVRIPSSLGRGSLPCISSQENFWLALTYGLIPGCFPCTLEGGVVTCRCLFLPFKLVFYYIWTPTYGRQHIHTADICVTGNAANVKVVQPCCVCPGAACLFCLVKAFSKMLRWSLFSDLANPSSFWVLAYPIHRHVAFVMMLHYLLCLVWWWLGII